LRIGFIVDQAHFGQPDHDTVDDCLVIPFADQAFSQRMTGPVRTVQETQRRFSAGVDVTRIVECFLTRCTMRTPGGPTGSPATVPVMMLWHRIIVLRRDGGMCPIGING
jgi:hypothetical protein